MKTLLRFSAAAILAAGLSVSTANAKGMGGGGGGGHAVGGGGVGHSAPSASFKGGGGPRVGGFVQRAPQGNIGSSRVHRFDGDHMGRHHHHGRFLAYSVPLYDYDSSYGYSNGCGWLWQRYLNTGSLRWKHRYYECIE